MDSVFGQKARDDLNLKPTNVIHTMAAFLDLSKVFDNALKNKLLSKLYSKFNMRGKIFPWFVIFLGDKYVLEKLKDSVSERFRLSQGFLQGFVLSRTLFSFFILGIERPDSMPDRILLDCNIWNVRFSSSTYWKNVFLQNKLYQSK